MKRDLRHEFVSHEGLQNRLARYSEGVKGMKEREKEQTKLSESIMLHRSRALASDDSSFCTPAIPKYFIDWPFQIYSAGKSLIRWMLDVFIESIIISLNWFAFGECLNNLNTWKRTAIPSHLICVRVKPTLLGKLKTQITTSKFLLLWEEAARMGERGCFCTKLFYYATKPIIWILWFHIT